MRVRLEPKGAIWGGEKGAEHRPVLRKSIQNGTIYRPALFVPIPEGGHRIQEFRHINFFVVSPDLEPAPQFSNTNAVMPSHANSNSAGQF